MCFGQDKQVQGGSSGTIGAMAGLVLGNMEKERCRRRRRRRDAGLPPNKSEEFGDHSKMSFGSPNLKLEIAHLPAGTNI